MVRTIKERIYLVSVLPLALLAVALVLFNGLYRIDEARRELRSAQSVTAELLNGAATEALVLGNTLNFEQVVTAAMKTSPVLRCITLRDTHQRSVFSAGECSGVSARTEFSSIKAPVDGLSDFNEAPRSAVAIGELGILMSQENVLEKRQQVFIQFGLSLVLIAIVLTLVARLLRGRLIEPIQRIDQAMQALSQRHYDARVHVRGEDELARLAQEVNKAILTIANYTRELERHRGDAERALHDADEANMARESLVRSLTEELEEPMNRMNAALTAIALANQDSALRLPIKNVLSLLQEAEANFADLIEVASSAQPDRRFTLRDLAEVISEVHRDVHVVSEAERVPVHFIVTHMPPTEAQDREAASIFVDVDGARLRKALVYLIRAMARRCNEAGVNVSMEVIKKSSDELHLSVHLSGFYDTEPDATTLRWMDELSHYSSTPPRILGWSEREVRIIAYLLRTVGFSPTFGTTPNGTVSILLDTTCRYALEHTDPHVPTDGMIAARPISTTLVSDDETLARLTSRSDLANYDVSLVPFAQAMSAVSALRSAKVLLVDVSDIAAALAFLDRLKAADGAMPHLVAICPAGHVSDSLGNRLFELGFAGIVQKPLHYGRVIQVIRSVLASPFQLNGSTPLIRRSRDRRK